MQCLQYHVRRRSVVWGDCRWKSGIGSVSRKGWLGEDTQSDERVESREGEIELGDAEEGDALEEAEDFRLLVTRRIVCCWWVRHYDKICIH